MANVPLSRRKDAHYHAIRSTERWAEFVAALGAATRRPADQREREDEQRRRETTYARGTLGGS